MRCGLMVEICSGEKIAVIGHGNSGHAAPSSFCSQFTDFTGAVEKRIVRVQMQVYEVRRARRTHVSPF